MVNIFQSTKPPTKDGKGGISIHILWFDLRNYWRRPQFQIYLHKANGVVLEKFEEEKVILVIGFVDPTHHTTN
jgi:hypothetical protein